jgi:hypothetical protein
VLGEGISLSTLNRKEEENAMRRKEKEDRRSLKEKNKDPTGSQNKIKRLLRSNRYFYPAFFIYKRHGIYF